MRTFNLINSRNVRNGGGPELVEPGAFFSAGCVVSTKERSLYQIGMLSRALYCSR